MDPIVYKAILALSNPDKALVFSYLGDDPKSTWELTKEVPLEDKIVENVLRGIRTKNKLEGAIDYCFMNNLKVIGLSFHPGTQKNFRHYGKKNND